MDAALLVQYKAPSAPTLTLPDTLFSTFWLFPSFLLKINAFTMRYEIWKGREKKKFGQSVKGGIEPLVDRVKKTWLVIYHLHHWSWDMIDSAVLLLVLYTLIDRCLVQSAVSNLFPNQWRCLKLYLPLPVCLICRCVFWLVVLFSDLSLFSDLFCFRICHCVFWLVIMFSGLLLCFLNCYLVFYICICVCNLLFCFQNCDLFCTSRPPYFVTPCSLLLQALSFSVRSPTFRLVILQLNRLKQVETSTVAEQMLSETG